jgi:hypothetical protein
MARLVIVLWFNEAPSRKLRGIKKIFIICDFQGVSTEKSFERLKAFGESRSAPFQIPL